MGRLSEKVASAVFMTALTVIVGLLLSQFIGGVAMQINSAFSSIH